VNGEIIVRVADFRAGANTDVLMTIGLGSCVAVVLHDATARVGGLAHVLLPSQALSGRTTTRPSSRRPRFHGCWS
jgi:Chemotaxis protein; stimulates methylation of MCP proteins